MALLEVRGLTKRFGGLTAVAGVDLTVETGEIVSVIGPNGAGKTTLFELVSGNLRPDAGGIRFRDVDLVGRPPHAIARLGLVRTFQASRVFANLTVLENVLVGAHGRIRYGLLGALLRPPAVARGGSGGARPPSRP
jgi:branched-chain amino acid transport system ATP-binding protein